MLLHGDKALAGRQANRTATSCPCPVVDSQFATLEPFEDDELGITPDAYAVDDLVTQAVGFCSRDRWTGVGRASPASLSPSPARRAKTRPLIPFSLEGEVAGASGGR